MYTPYLAGILLSSTFSVENFAVDQFLGLHFDNDADWISQAHPDNLGKCIGHSCTEKSVLRCFGKTDKMRAILWVKPRSSNLAGFFSLRG